MIITGRAGESQEANQVARAVELPPVQPVEGRAREGVMERLTAPLGSPVESSFHPGQPGSRSTRLPFHRAP